MIIDSSKSITISKGIDQFGVTFEGQQRVGKLAEELFEQRADGMDVVAEHGDQGRGVPVGNSAGIEDLSGSGRRNWGELSNK